VRVLYLGEVDILAYTHAQVQRLGGERGQQRSTVGDAAGRVGVGVMVVTLVDALLHVLYLGVISRLAKQALLFQHLCRETKKEKEERRGRC
jgi:hypothetical protein